MRILLTLFFSLCFACIAPANSGYPHCYSIAARLDNMLSHLNPQVKIGLVVQSVATGRIYYAKNANRYFEPASVQKLFTASSALLNLKPDFRFNTRIFSNGSVRGDTLYGNLIFKFSGDPAFTQQQLNSMIKRLSDIGIHRVVGNILIDNTAYNHAPYPAGWLWDDLSFDFAAPLDPIIINRNRFGLTLVPARQIGQHPQLIPHLPPGAATFYNEAITTRRSCPLTILSNEKNQYMVRGCLPRTAGKIGRSLAIRNVEQYARSLIRALMIKNNIGVSGRVLIQKAPQKATLLAEHASPVLSQLIIHLLKKSDNLYADSLLKKMGQHYTKTPGSWENGLQAMLHSLAERLHIDPHHLHCIDGAGLSRYNLITPYHLSLLLAYIANNTMLRDTLIPALPIAGVDGTLAYRMPSLARGKLLRAKTGSMKGVSTLAGYARSKHHGSLLFVIMLNNIPKNRYPYIMLENRIGEFLVNSPSCG